MNIPNQAVDAVNRNRRRYMVKDVRLVFLTPSERRDMEYTPPELEEEACFYFWRTGKSDAV